jgi:hypothetical protein
LAERCDFARDLEQEDRMGVRMSNRQLEWFGALAAAVAAVAVVPSAGQTPASGSAATGAQRAYTAPRTADGQPDLGGVWANNSVTPLERPKQLEGREFLTDEEVARLKARAQELFNGDGDAAFGDEIFAAALSDRDKYVADSFDKATGNYNSFWLVGRDFDNRTSLITSPRDGRVPPLTAEGQKRMKQMMALLSGGGRADSHEDRPLSERCITFGMPDTLAGYNSYYQFVQSPGWVAIYTERIHDVRLIPLDGRPHLPKNVKLLNGDSRGRWEGETLVVDTTNFNSQSGFRGSSENLHLIERFTRVSPDTIAYEITMDDPTIWTQPWTLMIPLKRTTDLIYEYACHEGNIGIMGVLSGARAEEKAAAGR